jgi:hypothetical protein
MDARARVGMSHMSGAHNTRERMHVVCGFVRMTRVRERGRDPQPRARAGVKLCLLARRACLLLF